MKTMNVIFKEGKGSLIWLPSVHEAVLPALLARVENLWTICIVGHTKIPRSGKSLAGTKWKMLPKNKTRLLWDLAFQARSDWLCLVGEMPDYQVSERYIDEWIETETSIISGNLSLGNQTVNHFPVSALQIQREYTSMKPVNKFRSSISTILICLLTSVVMGASAVSQTEC